MGFILILHGSWMGWKAMEFRAGGTRVSFSFGFFAVLAVYMLVDREGIGLPALAAVVLHESGHIVLMRLTGYQIPEMRFSPFGVQIERWGLLPDGREAAVYLGGVLANLLTGGIAWLFCGWNLFTIVSLGLILFNLLPVGRLDGGQLLRLALGRGCSPEHADRLQKWIGFLVLTPLFAYGFYLAAQGNYTLLLTAGYLAVTLLRG